MQEIIKKRQKGEKPTREDGDLFGEDEDGLKYFDFGCQVASDPADHTILALWLHILFLGPTVVEDPNEGRFLQCDRITTIDRSMRRFSPFQDPSLLQSCTRQCCLCSRLSSVVPSNEEEHNCA